LTISAAIDGDSLIGWLTSLGWQVELGRDGEVFVAVASRPNGFGGSLRVGACARTQADLAYQIFEAASSRLEAARRTDELQAREEARAA